MKDDNTTPRGSNKQVQ